MRRLVYAIIAGIAIIAGCELTTKAQRTQSPEILIVDLSKQLPSNPYQEEYEQMLWPTVRIKTPFSTGSGVIINHKDTKDTKTIYILTACHVVNDANEVNIEFYDSTVITASVVISDTTKDLAFLCVLSDLYGEKVYSAKLAPKNHTPYLFSPVWAVGCSLGLPPRPSFGHLCALCDLCGEPSYWEISAPILPGNSGGPVFDANTYEVIGIAVWVQTYQGQLITTMAGVVPVSEIYEFLKEYTD